MTRTVSASDSVSIAPVERLQPSSAHEQNLGRQSLARCAAAARRERSGQPVLPDSPGDAWPDLWARPHGDPDEQAPPPRPSVPAKAAPEIRRAGPAGLAFAA